MWLLDVGSKIRDIQGASGRWLFFKFIRTISSHWYTPDHHLTLIKHSRASHSNLNLKVNSVFIYFFFRDDISGKIAVDKFIKGIK